VSLTGISRRTGRISLAQNPPLIGPTSFFDSSVAIVDFNLSQWGRLSEDLKMKLPYLFAFICWVQTVQGCLRLSFQRPPSRSIHTCCSGCYRRSNRVRCRIRPDVRQFYRPVHCKCPYSDSSRSPLYRHHVVWCTTALLAWLLPRSRHAVLELFGL